MIENCTTLLSLQSFSKMSCETVYNGVLLQSYLWIFISSAGYEVFMIVFFICCMILSCCFQSCHSFWIRPNPDRNDEDLLPVSDNNTSQGKGGVIRGFFGVIGSVVQGVGAGINAINAAVEKKKKEEAKQFQFDVAFFCYQLLYVWSTFIIAIVKSFEDSDQSSWRRYTNLYGFLMNSTVLTSTVSFLLYYLLLPTKYTFELKKAEQLGYIQLFTVGVILLPPFITHVIPALFAYIWVAVIICLPLLFAMIATEAIIKKHLLHFDDGCFGTCFSTLLICWGLFSGCLTVFLSYFANIFARTTLILLIQTLYNYMASVYDISAPLSGHEYLRVIGDEHRLRLQTKCIFEANLESFYAFASFFNFM